MRRFKTEIPGQQVPVAIELPERFMAVASRDVASDQQAMGRLAQRIIRDQPNRNIDRKPNATLGLEPLSRCLERAHPKEAQALAIEDDPIVVELGQELGGGGKAFDDVICRRDGPAKQVQRDVPQVIKVDMNVQGQSDSPTAGARQLPVGSLESPKARPQPGIGPILAGVRPQAAGNGRSARRSAGEGEVG